MAIPLMEMDAPQHARLSSMDGVVLMNISATQINAETAKGLIMNNVTMVIK